MIVTALCLFPMLRNGLTNWDDEYYVVSNSLLPGPDWMGILTRPVVSNYHPLTVLSLAANYAMSGTQAWSYLLFNLTLHLVNVILVFRFIYAISDKKIEVAFATALLFGIHPMHVESVAWISERKDVLYTLFYLLALMQYWRFLETGKRARLWLCFLLFELSLLSKPAAIILPLTLFLLDYWKQRPLQPRLLLEKIPFLLVAGVFTVVTLKLQSVTAMTSLSAYPFWVRLLFACYAVAAYSIRFFVPYPLSAFHPFPSPHDLGWALYASPLFIVGLLFLLCRLRSQRLIVFGFAFFFVNLLLVLQLVSIGFTIISERYTYVAYIGLAFLLTMWLSNHGPLQMPARAGAIALFALFGFLSFQRTQVWKDSDSLWTDVIKHYPDAVLPRAERAQFNYNRAITTTAAEAASLFKRVIEDCTVAINQSRHASKEPPKPDGKPSNYRPLNYMRGVAYDGLKQYDQALEDFNACLLIKPDDPEVLYSRGSLLVNHYQRNDEALVDFDRAIQISPQGRYYLNRSICHYKLGDRAKAIADAQMALQKGVAIPDDYRNALNAGR